MGGRSRSVNPPAKPEPIEDGLLTRAQQLVAPHDRVPASMPFHPPSPRTSKEAEPVVEPCPDVLDRRRVHRTLLASSIASGNPSSRCTISATIGVCDSTRPDPAAAARSVKRRTPSSDVNEGSARIRSPLTASPSRLVASTTRPGQRTTSAPTSRATSSSRCSQLSSTSGKGSGSTTSARATRSSEGHLVGPRRPLPRPRTASHSPRSTRPTRPATLRRRIGRARVLPLQVPAGSSRFRRRPSASPGVTPARPKRGLAPRSHGPRTRRPPTAGCATSPPRSATGGTRRKDRRQRAGRSACSRRSFAETVPPEIA